MMHSALNFKLPETCSFFFDRCCDIQAPSRGASCLVTTACSWGRKSLARERMTALAKHGLPIHRWEKRGRFNGSAEWAHGEGRWEGRWSTERNGCRLTHYETIKWNERVTAGRWSFIQSWKPPSIGTAQIKSMKSNLHRSNCVKLLCNWCIAKGETSPTEM